ncbi:nitrous oxide reductase family maturation protein NosD [Bacillus sp. HMF5848]|uniref:right-handed parallel beta-helix repeat-containing protein n=1 Tax=Bacillus sp. HMF5848 TaxID=2495421 RepID=UPI000F7AD452|nr:nitrous oxide reductase family maturation protein NosD [Bacillus sp. HMF5848]RSK28402.1 nitrous oxide reductase family maturation protein NosD [Bacillus sp. HMF5848]
MQKYAFSIFALCLFFIGSYDNVFAQQLIVKQGESIQGVIDKAANGDSIVVKAGLYEENLVIDKEINLFGENGTILDGGGQGTVITVNSSNVHIKDLNIRMSGKKDRDAGVLITGDNVKIEDITIEQVLFGIYAIETKGTTILNNKISSYPLHFSQRGSGVHLFKTGHATVNDNHIFTVQDGIYLDFAKNSMLTRNKIHGARYALHFMYSSGAEASYNELFNSINGLMVMETKQVDIHNNIVTKQLHYRGYGVLLYDSDLITFSNNTIMYNSNGLQVEDLRESVIKNNTVAGNHVGLAMTDENVKVSIFKNNFIGNVVQAKLVDQGNLNIDNGFIGNYWDDHQSFDLDGDGILDTSYEAGSMYDKLLIAQPTFQFYFESPAIKTWASAESLLPSVGVEKGIDRFPVNKPFEYEESEEKEVGRNGAAGIIGILFIISAVALLQWGRMNRA